MALHCGSEVATARGTDAIPCYADVSWCCWVLDGFNTSDSSWISDQGSKLRQLLTSNTFRREHGADLKHRSVGCSFIDIYIFFLDFVASPFEHDEKLCTGSPCRQMRESTCRNSCEPSLLRQQDPQWLSPSTATPSVGSMIEVSAPTNVSEVRKCIAEPMFSAKMGMDQYLLISMIPNN